MDVVRDLARKTTLAIAVVLAGAAAGRASGASSDAGFGAVRLGDTEASISERGYDCRSAFPPSRRCSASGLEVLGLAPVTMSADLEHDAVESIELDVAQADAAAIARRLRLRFGDVVSCGGDDCTWTLADGVIVTAKGSHVVLTTLAHTRLAQMRGHMILQLRIGCRAPGEKTDEQRRECAGAGL